MLVRYAGGIVSSSGLQNDLIIGDNMIFNCNMYFNGESEMAQ